LAILKYFDQHIERYFDINEIEVSNDKNSDM